jgi:hypothetical protein
MTILTFHPRLLFLLHILEQQMGFHGVIPIDHVDSADIVLFFVFSAGRRQHAGLTGAML